MYLKKAKRHVILGIVEQMIEIQNAEPGIVNDIKVRRQKDIHMGKSQKTCVLLAIGVLSMSSKSGDKRTYVWAKGEGTCVLFSYWMAREGNSECSSKFH